MSTQVSKILSSFNLLNTIKPIAWQILQHLYNPWLITTKIIRHNFFQEIVVLVHCKLLKQRNYFLFVGRRSINYNLNVNTSFQLSSTKIWCPLLKHTWCMMHIFKQHWRRNVCNYKQLFTTMAMVCHKRYWLAMVYCKKESKEKRAKGLVSGYKCCMKL